MSKARFAGAGALLLTLCTSFVAHAHDLVPPKPKTQPAPSWPVGKSESRDVIVPLIVTIDEKGAVTNAEVEAPVGPEIDRAALDTIKTWTFEPASRDGKPVSAKIRSMMRFAGTSEVTPTPAPAPTTPEPAAAPPAPPAAAPVETVHVQGNAPPRSASEVVRGKDVILAAPHRTASDVLSVVPGVFITQHSGEGKAHQIFLRGFDAVHGQDIEINVGGIPINEVSNVHGQGYADLHFVMPEVIKEIQSTPGTYDPKQGDFAVAGSIRMKLGYDEPGATIKGTIGSFGAHRIFLAYHPKDASDETFAAFEEYATDGFGPNRAARRGSMIVQGTHDFADGLSLRVLGTTYSGRFDSAGVLPRKDIESGKVARFATLDPKQNGYSSRTQVLTELHKDSADGERWSIAPYIAFRTLHLRQNFTGYFTDTQRGGKPTLESDNNQQMDERIQVGATATFRKPIKLFSTRDSLEVGVSGRHDIISQSQRRLSAVNDQPTQTLVDADVRGTNAAGWFDLSIAPLRRLVLRGGVRGDALSYTAEDRAVPAGQTVQATQGQGRAAQGAHFGKKLTVDYTIGWGVKAIASYGEGFRSPQARSLSEGEKTFFTDVTSYEAGLRYSHGQRLAGSVAAFYTSLSQDLVFDPATTRNETVPGTERKGIAAELTSRATDWLLLSSSATYTQATFTAGDATYGKGDFLPYVPQLVLRTDTQAKKVLAHVWNRDLEGRVGAGLEGLVSRPLPYGEKGQDVFLVDASAGLRLKEVELGLDVFNVFDTKWYDGQFVFASNFARVPSPPRVPFQHVTAGPPRTLFFSLTLHV